MNKIDIKVKLAIGVFIIVDIIFMSYFVRMVFEEGKKYPLVLFALCNFIMFYFLDKKLKKIIEKKDDMRSR